MTGGARRRVLIVTSTWEPAMTADMQRARMLAWDLPHAGWEVEILSPDTSYQHPLTEDTDSADFFPAGVRAHPVRAWLPGLFRALGIRTIGWRSILPMYWVGRRVLRAKKFDVVYFSTTQFILFCLGPLWQSAAGTRYVVDFHDPWYRDGPTQATSRHAWKQRVSNALGKLLESFAMRFASGCIAVSPSYVEILRARHADGNPPWIRPECAAVVPFAVCARDFDSTPTTAHGMVDRDLGQRIISIAYVGVGGGIMQRSFGAICAALSALRADHPELVNRVRMRCYGTMLGWQAGDRKHLLEAAQESGVADLVQEEPQRVSYRRSLEILTGADAALVLGVDDAGYIPSKLFSYALSGKPLLGCFRHDSPACAWFDRFTGFGHLLKFGDHQQTAVEQAREIVLAYLREADQRRRFERGAMLRSQLSTSMAMEHARLFEACLR